MQRNLDRREFLTAVSAGLALPACKSAAPPAADLRLWYGRPAAEWVEALPVGNGRLGAMVFGGVSAERIQFNEDTVWQGVPHDYAAPGRTATSSASAGCWRTASRPRPSNWRWTSS